MNTLLTFYHPYPKGSPRSPEHWANCINDTKIAKYPVEAVGSFNGQAGPEIIQAIGDASQRVAGRIAVAFAAISGGLRVVAEAITNTERKDHEGIKRFEGSHVSRPLGGNFAGHLSDG